jgi:prolyl-tRNA editing enzyme YbaK/EbsC (Cys-tRNA(Pro) deacylase)
VLSIVMGRRSANGQPTSQDIGMTPNDVVRTLLCLVEGDTTIFQVQAPVDNNVLDLKELVYEKGVGVARGPVLAKDLVLWKVSQA